MALINCRECSKQVSDAAPFCPNCGVPIAGAAEASATGTPITTVQQTSKRLKTHILASIALIVFGGIWIAAQHDPSRDTNPIPVLIVLLALIWFVVTRFRVWWHHH